MTEWFETTLEDVLDKLQDGDRIIKDGKNYIAARDGLLVVLLCTDLTPELIREGQARDIIRDVQVKRKESGLQIQDRIALKILGPENIKDTVQEWGNLIKSEVLATSLEFEVGEKQEYVLKVQAPVV